MIDAGMAKPGSVIGWKLDRGERTQLLERFPPRYDEPVADHVTLETNAESKPLPPELRAEIVGRADDGGGVEAMVVALDGSTDRPDGSTFHVTWSLGPGRRARESNDVIRERGWTDLEAPVPVTITPARF
jgi:hypothetical protein